MEQELIWNLSELFDSREEFYNEIEKLVNEINEIAKFKNSTFDSDILLMVLNKKWEIKEKANNVLIYGSLNYYKDVENEGTKKMKAAAERLMASVDTTLGFINEKIIELGEETINEYIKANNKLEIYQLYLDNIFRLKSHIQDDETNSKIEQLKNGINNSLTEYDSLSREINLGVITVDSEEIKLTPSNISKYLSSRDRETRRQAYLSVNGSYK